MKIGPKRFQIIWPQKETIKRNENYSPIGVLGGLKRSCANANGLCNGLVNKNLAITKHPVSKSLHMTNYLEVQSK